MLENIKSFFRKVGVKMGIIKEYNQLQEHRKLDIDEEAFNRIATNKAIYKGFVKDWNHIRYLNSNGQFRERDMMTLGMGKVTARKMAKLIFNERCYIDVSSYKDGQPSEYKDKADVFIRDTLDKNGFYKDFPRYLEYCYALGGIAMKVYEHKGLIKIAYAVADSFIPISNDSENIDEGVFITKEKKNKKHYTLLEWHEWEDDLYVVTNELFESDRDDTLGYKVPLNTLYPDLEERTTISGLTSPLFVYLKPNTANNFDLTSPLGISIYENSYDTLKQIDYLYDFYYHEFKLGKRRISVNREMTKQVVHDDGSTSPVFDSEETVYVPLGVADGEPVKDLTVGLRVNEIIQAINHQLDILAMQMGLSAGTFTFDGRGLMTATQVISENSETYQTKNDHETLVEKAIHGLVKAIINLALLYGLYNGTADVEVAVNFDDSIAEDRKENYNYYAQAVRDGLYPKARAIEKIFKVTEDEAYNILSEIQEEKNQAIKDEVDFRMDMVGLEQEINIDKNKKDK